MADLRVGLVGTGFAGKFHTECLRRIHGLDVELAGVTSLRAESRAAFGKEHDIAVYEDVAAMLPHIDVLDICSPPAAHDQGMRLAAEADKHIICEKPLSGYFGPHDAGEAYRGNEDAKEPMLDKVVTKLEDLAATIRKAGVTLGYAENFVYAPAVQKEREILEKTGAQILRMMGEESHNGSGSPVYGLWREQGGGSLMGKGCHPLTALLYLKRVEGLTRTGEPIRPKTVTCRCEELTRLPGYEDRGFIRTEYLDTEDHVWAHVTFTDGTVGDIQSGEIVLGGIHNYVEVFANNHRTRCNLSPANMMETFNPKGEQYRDVYTVEKISTKEGWTTMVPDENYTLGYLHELQDFLECVVRGTQPQSDLNLALDTITTIYAGYVSDEKQGAAVEIPLL